MLTLQSRFRLNDTEVTAQVLDGEAIMINLSTGVYYSMDKVGGFLWAIITGGHSLAEAAAAASARYDVSAEQVQADVKRVVEELISEGLITVADDVRPPQVSEERHPESRLVYESPQLNIYRDMSELLALDPPMPSFNEIPWKESTDRSTG
ncbi:protein of unknown function [Candidatus Methylomirabilis oxygeniifera]|uniref:PqqD family protein n=1 Tax=Methylomirabilis oxygeniifera TaxID=671143 RepID=D5MLZ8_METO1|nr:protein of unknown function [Candidatus Methylomirabilis oxyfera]